MDAETRREVLRWLATRRPDDAIWANCTRRDVYEVTRDLARAALAAEPAAPCRAAPRRGRAGPAAPAPRRAPRAEHLWVDSDDGVGQSCSRCGQIDDYTGINTACSGNVDER